MFSVGKQFYLHQADSLLTCFDFFERVSFDFCKKGKTKMMMNLVSKWMDAKNLVRLPRQHYPLC